MKWVKYFGSCLMIIGAIFLMVYLVDRVYSDIFRNSYEDFVVEVDRGEALKQTEDFREETVVAEPPVPEIASVESYEIQPRVVLPLTDGYVFDDKIDLSSGEPLALVIDLPDGKILKTNWAGAVGFSEADNQEDIFKPRKGIIYSYIGDVLTTWAHSGVSYGQRYFATNLDFYLRKGESGEWMAMDGVQEKSKSLIGSQAYICQMKSGEVKFLSDYDGVECLGDMVELELVAIAIVPHEDLEEYDVAITNINEWLSEKYPESGFESLSKDNAWIIRFCVDWIPDQEYDGSPTYLYNRGVMGFRVKE